jgi:hypothetical protein
MLSNIFGLDIANGLKELLLTHGFTLDMLLKTPPTELAIILGIDLYVARLIYMAARAYVESSKDEKSIDSSLMDGTASA